MLKLRHYETTVTTAAIILRGLVFGVVLLVLATSTVAGEIPGAALEPRLQQEIGQSLDDTLARLKAASPSEAPPANLPNSVKPLAGRFASDPASLAITRNQEIEASLADYRERRADRLRRGLARFAAYEPQIVTGFQEAGVPQELALVGLVESGFNPLAASRRHARGIWQFVPNTGRRYGLRIAPGVDERTDPAKSTQAAARYLADLYQQFGDWPLALAAYNSGENRVLRAITRTGLRDFWSLSRMRLLPAETRSYVPAVLAAILYVHGPQWPPFNSTRADLKSTKPGRIFFATSRLSGSQEGTN